ncbi:hypothetical protein K2173_028505 [Erythroxylum novogranatense]|uniref:Uncharacterized protein n=1 Tax=Erythroxylum novogranatense TaxID=1862640 RepID=A0AAV8U640_9ROSI|nr:hypothetical protein K2173_028505 [Erythroxylum novogranatense]
MDPMVSDILLQVGLILLLVFVFLKIHDVPSRILSKLRIPNKANIQAKRHFVRGAQLLSQAASPSNSRAISISLAKQAEEEAQRAIAFDPKDAAAHILKALALDLQGFKTSALESLDVALSPIAVKSLSDKERGDALFKRADMTMQTKRQERLESAVNDLTEAVKLSPENAEAFNLLGKCYESKNMKEEAEKAYEMGRNVKAEVTGEGEDGRSD